MPSPVIQFKRGASSGITSFRAGEPAFTTDTFDFYIGLDNTLANNKFFGSHRYWTKENGSRGSGVNLVESTGGSDFITLAAPASVGAAVTYTFPASPTDGYFLKTNSTGTLSWSNQLGSASFDELTTGIATVTSKLDVTSTTDSTTKDNGAVIIEGGVGIEKSVNIGGNLKVTGVSTFVGSVTFEGGTINLGDADTDDINVAGEFISNLVPNADVTYSVGTSSKRWNSVHTRDLNVSGIATVTGLGDFNSGIDVSGHANVYDLTVTGITTIGGKIDGNNTLEIDGHVTFNAGSITTGIATFNSEVDINGALSVDQQTSLNNNLLVVGFSTLQSAVQLDSTLSVAAHTDLNSSLEVSGISTFLSGVNVSGSVDISGNLRVSGITTIGDASSDTLTVNATTTFVEPVVGTIGTATRATTVDTTATSSNSEFYPTFTSSSSSSTSATINVDAGVSYNPGTNTLTVPTVNVGTLKASDGTTAITINNTTGNVGVSSNLTVTGNLYVLGSTTEVNTETLKVEDSLIEVGLINDNGSLVPPTSDSNIDVGVLFNWYDISAKKAGVFWDDSAGRIVLGKDLSETSSVMTVTSYADIEIGSLWVNDCAGQSQVISCTGSERFLENITVDGGSF